MAVESKSDTYEDKLKRERRARKAIKMLQDMLIMMGYRQLTPMYILDPRTGEKYCE